MYHKEHIQIADSSTLSCKHTIGRGGGVVSETLPSVDCTDSYTMEDVGSYKYPAEHNVFIFKLFYENFAKISLHQTSISFKIMDPAYIYSATR